MLEENAQYQESFRLYTIEQTLKKDHQAYKYNYETFIRRYFHHLFGENVELFSGIWWR